MTILNIQHFLVEQEHAILSIPDLTARLEAIESLLGRVEGDEDQDQDDTLSPVESEDTGGGSVETLDQGDYDEVFAAGGATERSWNYCDWADLYEQPNI